MATSLLRSAFTRCRRSVQRHASLRFLLVCLASYLLLLSFYFAEISKGYNYLELFPDTIPFSLAVYALTALLIGSVATALKVRTPTGKLIIVTLVSFCMANYDSRLQKVSPLFDALNPLAIPPDVAMAVYSIIFLAILFGVATLIALLVEKAVSRSQLIQNDNLTAGIGVLIGFIFMSQFVTLMSILPPIFQQATVAAPALPKGEAHTPITDKPDIYYIVFDRYTNDTILTKQFGFDNSKFTQFLAGRNFFVNDNAYSNYPQTTSSLASTFVADYTKGLVAPFRHDTTHSRTLYHNLIMQSPVVKALKDHGYAYYSLGANYGASDQAPLADQDFTSEATLYLFGKEVKRLHDLEVSTFRQSFFYRLASLSSLPWLPLQLQETSDVDYIRNQFVTLDKLAQDKPGGRFIFAHILEPHEPFLFNSDGSLAIAASDDRAKINKRKYTDQINFINNQIQETIDLILKQSQGQAVILFNADEGPYPTTINRSFKQPTVSISSNMLEWTDDDLQLKYGIQQAVRIPKATPEDMANLSSVNLFRIILDRYLGYRLEYRPECHFAFDHSDRMEFLYADVTQRLTGSTSQFCQDMQSRP